VSGTDRPPETAAVDAAILAGLETVATIVATVDLERALAEIGSSARPVGAPVDDPLLGARVVLLDTVADGWIALAEPTTEGRLTASLARHGEGSAGRYVAAAEPFDRIRARAAAAGIALSRVEIGPFGRSVLVLSGPVTGPSLVVVERRTLPSPP
jgi:hypothetical protein